MISSRVGAYHAMGEIRVANVAAMKTACDREADVEGLRFKETTATTNHGEHGIALHYDSAHRLVGIEILDDEQRLAKTQTCFNPVNPQIPKILVQTSAPAESNSSE